MTTELDLDDVAAQSPLAMRELAELRTDVERYRWLRESFSVMSPDIDGNHTWMQRGMRLRGPNMDAAVDEEIRKQAEWLAKQRKEPQP